MSYADFLLSTFVAWASWVTKQDVYTWFPTFDTFELKMHNFPSVVEYNNSGAAAISDYPFYLRMAKVNDYVSTTQAAVPEEPKKAVKAFQSSDDEDDSIANPF